jgi:hypothetical protein
MFAIIAAGGSLDHSHGFVLVDGLRLAVVQQLLDVLQHLLPLALGIALVETLPDGRQRLHRILNDLPPESWRGGCGLRVALKHR